MHRYLNVVYAYLVEAVKRPDQTLQSAIDFVEKALGPPPTAEEKAEAEARANAEAMRSLGAFLPPMPPRTA